MGLSKLPHSVGVLCILRPEFCWGVSSGLPAPPKIVQSLVYIECVKFKESKKVGSSYDKLFTTFSNLIPAYRNLVVQEFNQKGNTEILKNTKDLMGLIKEGLIKEGKDGLEIIDDPNYKTLASNYISLAKEQERYLKNRESQKAADTEELFNSLLRITTEIHEEPIWAKNIAIGYLQEFRNLIEGKEKVDE